ncbi:unnamed protein product [Miscanthus lutarioriparius]|uniref:Uncharacterized protein n=1 Tax=Miscanthus lutarioriparius TaxID=422564 RepID=A0A811REF4_9POAL|nr:unnamed protein product [Miscanthus lutarioriparius]CAD6268663.1 unnamed protein product [Miscanthus lutarioriparius]
MNKPAKVNVTNGSYTNETTDSSNGYSPEKHLKVDRKFLPIHSRQEMVFSDEYKPISKPIKKVGEELQPIKKVEACVSIFPMYNLAIHLIWIA